MKNINMTSLKIKLLLTTTGASVISGVGSLILTFLIAHLITPSQYGYYSIYVLILNLYFMFFNFGMNISSTYYLSSSQLGIKRLIKIDVMFLILIALATICGMAILEASNGWLFIEHQINIPKSVVIVGFVAGFLFLIFNFVTAVLLGCLQYDNVNVLNVIRVAVPLVVTGLVTFTARTGLSAARSYTVGLAIVVLLSISLLYNYLNKNRHHFIEKKQEEKLSKMLRYGAFVYASNIFHYGSMRGLIFILTSYATAASVGFFSIALTLLDAFLIIPNSLGQLIFPYSSKNKIENADVTFLVRINLLVGGFISIIIYFFSENVLAAALGNTYRTVALVLIYMIPSIIILNIPKILSQVLSGSGKPEYPLLAAIASFIIGGWVSLTIVPKYGVVGASIGIDIISLVTAIITIVGYCRLTQNSWQEFVQPKISDLGRLKEIAFRLLAKA